MQPKTPKLLEDIRDGCAFILDSTANLTLDEFRTDRMRSQAVERNFEIIGEALNRLARSDPDVASRISDYPQIISFRNVLIHGYDTIDQLVVWEVIAGNVPPLLREVQALLAEVTPKPNESSNS
jgi:uncharacterized protein with HEPN domain